MKVFFFSFFFSLSSWQREHFLQVGCNSLVKRGSWSSFPFLSKTFLCKGCLLRVSLWDRSTKRLHRWGCTQGASPLGGGQVQVGEAPVPSKVPTPSQGIEEPPVPLPACTNPQLCSAFARGMKMPMPGGDEEAEMCTAPRRSLCC